MMRSIEAHRAAIGRFSRKAKSYSLSSALKKNEVVDVICFIFLVTLWLTTLYTLVLTTMHQYLHYITFFLMVTLMYSYSLWILRKTSDRLCLTVEIMARNELMRAPSPSLGIKDFPLTPCNYLDTFVVDGRFKYLDTSVLDDGNWEPQKITIDSTKLMIYVKNYVQLSLIYTCNIIICSSSVYIGIDILSRMNNSYCGLHDLESYSVSFLKLSQLLLAGDVESNPGPVNNNDETPKRRGRPQKKGAKKLPNFMKPKKLDFTSVVIDNQVTTQPEMTQVNSGINNLPTTSDPSVMELDIEEIPSIITLMLMFLQ